MVTRLVFQGVALFISETACYFFLIFCMELGEVISFFFFIFFLYSSGKKFTNSELDSVDHSRIWFIVGV